MLKEFCEEKKMRRQLTILNTPQQNGMAKHRNETLLDMVRLMMGHINLLTSFCGYGVAHSSFYP